MDRSGEEENLRRLLQVLDDHPDAGVTGIQQNGLFCAIPDGIPVEGRTRLPGRSVFDLVAPGSIERVMDGWQRVMANGRSAHTLEQADGREVTVRAFNLFDTFGVAIMVWIVGVLPEVVAEEPEAAPILTSRFGRFRRDVIATITDVDEEAVGLLGWTLASLDGVEPTELVHPDDVENALANWFKVLANPGVPQRWRGRHKRLDGSWVWLEITNTNRLDDPEHGDVVSEMMDISEEMATAEALRRREELLRRLTEALPVGVVQFDVAGAIEHRNDQLQQVTGRSRASTVAEQFADVVDEDRPRLDEAVAACIAEGTSSSIEVRLHPNGSYQERVCQITLRALCAADGSVEGAVGSVSDVTESTRMRQELEVRATFDPLTSCYNRSSVMASLERALAGGSRPGLGAAVIFVDLDGFKGINDTLGHAAGDELLTTVASRLRAGVRGDDVVGRFGGDEFLVVCPSVTGPEEAMEIAARLATSVCAPMELGAKTIRPGASTGVAWAPAGDATADSLVAAADGAMYRSKGAGRCVPALAEV